MGSVDYSVRVLHTGSLPVAQKRPRPSLFADFRELASHFDLLRVWTQREVKVRYKQSVLGCAWAVLQPLSLMVILSIVFSVFARVETGNVPYVLFSLTALVPWTLLSTSMSFASASIVQNVNLVCKIYFPREILPIAAVLAAVLDFVVAAVFFVPMLLWYQTALSWNLLWVPVLLVVQLMLITGVVLILSAALVRFRDLRFVVPLVTQVWMYVSPVVYPASLVPERWSTLYFLNPMAGVLEAYRATVLDGRNPWGGPLLWSLGVAVVVFLGGYRFFKASEAEFADII